ncbi:MAG: hypothetical protein K0R66_1191 [Gammaproteobacteria bacterium]|jgi:Flp pilus assembly protein TadD|nr:hypothetical protein [Gammaproteobacteria bacterium]
MSKLIGTLLKVCKLHHSKAWYKKHHALARNLYRQGKPCEALREYKHILEDDPNDNVALTKLLIIEDRLRRSS